MKRERVEEIGDNGERLEDEKEGEMGEKRGSGSPQAYTVCLPALWPEQ